MNEGTYKLCEKLPGVILELEISMEQHEKIKDMLLNFISNSDYYKYNYKGLIYSILKIPMIENDTFLCSEFVYYLLKECDIADLNMSRNLVRPQSLLNIESRIIFKGDLKKINRSTSIKKMKEFGLEHIYQYAEI